jgi:predicted ribosome quality control (RQC) complex YloA/Tae2 family protein
MQKTVKKPEENKFEKETFSGYEIYTGKSAGQNRQILNKIASGNDFWFHAKDYPSAHIICKNSSNKEELEDDVIIYCAKKVKEYSALKNAQKASVIYTKKKYLRKPADAAPGFVLYSNEKEIVIE